MTRTNSAHNSCKVDGQVQYFLTCIQGVGLIDHCQICLIKEYIKPDNPVDDTFDHIYRVPTFVFWWLKDVLQSWWMGRCQKV